MATLTMLKSAPPAPPRRPRVVLFGTTLGSVAAAMSILSMLAMYLARRADVISTGETWLPKGSVIPLRPVNMLFATLLMSAITLAWARWALRRDDRQNAYVALGLTTLLGFAWVVQSTYLFSVSKIPVAAVEGQGVLFWSVVGAHFVMVLVGLVFLGLMTLRTLGGENRGNPEGVAAVAVVWYTAIGVYAAIWYAIYITK